MSSEILYRTLSSAPEILKGIDTGLYKIWGGVVRVAKGHEGAGQIVGHLQFPNSENQVKEAISQLSGGMSSAAADSLAALQQLQTANLVLSGLNLAVSTAGFAIVCTKLNGISEQISMQSEKLDLLIEMARDVKVQGDIRRHAEFSSVLKTIRQYSEENDIGMLKGQLAGLHTQYAETKLMLRHAAAGVGTKGGLDFIDVMRNLQERMMYLGFLQAHVQQRIGSPGYAYNALRDLKQDWLEINSVLVDTVAANNEWVEGLPYEAAENIVSFLEYRKEVTPAIEYQSSLLGFAVDNPSALQVLNEDVSEIRFIAA